MKMSQERFRIVVTGTGVVQEALERLRGMGARVDIMEGRVTEQSLLDEIDRSPVDAILMRSNPPVGRALFERALGLRVIAKHGVGVNSVDIEAATEFGVLVMVTGDANSPAVAEHAMALMFALGRDLPRLDRSMKAGQWARETFVGQELRGRTLGLVGFGRIGRQVAELARCVGMRVLALPRVAGSVDKTMAEEAPSLPSLLAEADIVSLHAPLTPATRHLIDRRTLSMMKPGAILINTARGGLVDEAALAEALREGRIAGAGLDNLDEEPPPPDCPLLTAPNTILTPHVAGVTTAALQRVGTMAAENIAAVLEGRRPDAANVVNPVLLEGARGGTTAS
jgi:D-3-phosphoglycerate dehydrogenase